MTTTCPCPSSVIKKRQQKLQQHAIIVGFSLRTAAAGLASPYKDTTDTMFGRCLANAVRLEITAIRIYQRTLPTTMRHTISLAVPLGYNVLQRQQTLSYMIVLMGVKASGLTDDESRQRLHVRTYARPHVRTPRCWSWCASWRSVRSALQSRVSQTLHDERQSPSLEQPPQPQLVHLLAVHQDFKKNEIVENKQLLHSLTIFEA